MFLMPHLSNLNWLSSIFTLIMFSVLFFYMSKKKNYLLYV